MEEKEQIKVTDEMIREANHFWEDPQKVMMLIDLLFLFDDPDKRQVCS